jgi:hypothetical protein
MIDSFCCRLHIVKPVVTNVNTDSFLAAARRAELVEPIDVRNSALWAAAKKDGITYCGSARTE